jgi:hypothetical protein
MRWCFMKPLDSRVSLHDPDKPSCCMPIPVAFNLSQADTPLLPCFDVACFNVAFLQVSSLASFRAYWESLEQASGSTGTPTMWLAASLGAQTGHGMAATMTGGLSLLPCCAPHVPCWLGALPLGSCARGLGSRDLVSAAL